MFIFSTVYKKWNMIWNAIQCLMAKCCIMSNIFFFKLCNRTHLPVQYSGRWRELCINNVFKKMFGNWETWKGYRWVNCPHLEKVAGQLVLSWDEPMHSWTVERWGNGQHSVEVIILLRTGDSLKGLSYEVDFENVDVNWQILAIIRAAAGFAPLFFRWIKTSSFR